MRSKVIKILKSAVLSDFHGLSSPSTLKRGNSYSILLSGAELAKLRKFLKTRKDKGAVEIDGEKRAVSVRYTFPSEPAWFKAFRRKQEEQPNKAMDNVIPGVVHRRQADEDER